MKCSTCNGSGKFPLSTEICSVCKGRGELPDTRLNNPPCPVCKATGKWPLSNKVCPTCQGWGKLPSEATNQVSLDIGESQIFKMLQKMLPSAAASYQQAILDLQDESRQSMRGTAVELREALREVLDHLAPDHEVKKMDNFKLEAGQTKPTMRQKTRFALRSRGYSNKSLKTANDAVRIVEELVPDFVRSVYTSGASATHVASEPSRVKQLKMYVDTVLSELLNVHETPNKRGNIILDGASSVDKGSMILRDIAISVAEPNIAKWTLDGRHFSVVQTNYFWCQWFHRKWIINDLKQKDLDDFNFGEKYYLFDLIAQNKINIPTGIDVRDKKISDIIKPGMVLMLRKYEKSHNNVIKPDQEDSTF